MIQVCLLKMYLCEYFFNSMHRRSEIIENNDFRIISIILCYVFVVIYYNYIVVNRRMSANLIVAAVA